MGWKFFRFLVFLFVVATAAFAHSQAGGAASSSVIDIDGNSYRTVRLGTQIWMAENLRVSRYCNGDAIPEVSGNSPWTRSQTGARSNANNTGDQQTIEAYGRLYNWYAANDKRGLAPAGWHIPSVSEWQVLMDYLGGREVAGGHLKAAGTKHWQYPNTSATDSSKFTALPGGNRDGNGGQFRNFGSSAYISLIGNEQKTWFAYLNFENGEVIVGSDDYLSDGFSIRCIKDGDR